MFAGVLRRELLILCRRPFVWLLAPAFFLLVTVVFAVAAADSPGALRAVAPGVLWSAALLASLLTQDGLFRADYDSGFIAQALLSAKPLPLFALAKAAAHWLLTGAPLLLIAPPAALLLDFPREGFLALLLTLPPGTAVLSLLAAFAAALTLGQRGALLSAILVLPLCVPVLIFAVAAVLSALSGFPYGAPLSFLAALAALALTWLPLATAGVLRAVGAGR